jgi:hypothetical protein
MPLTRAVASDGTEMSTAITGSSSTGWHFGIPSLIASRPAWRNAMSELSTV